VARVEAERIRLLAVEMLGAARSFYTLSRLSRVTGLDPSLISKYASGRVLPSPERAREIVERLRAGLDLAGIVLRAAEKRGILDVGLALSSHPVLKLVTLEFYLRLAGRGVTTVLVPEASGVPLASTLAMMLGADLVVARKSKGAPADEYLEAHTSAPPSIHRVYYAPKSLLERARSVLVVDDLIQSGYTLATMLKLAEAAGARVEAVAAVVVVGDSWRRVSGYTGPLEYVVRLNL